jgi:hypothetical protein
MFEKYDIKCSKQQLSETIVERYQFEVIYSLIFSPFHHPNKNFCFRYSVCSGFYSGIFINIRAFLLQRISEENKKLFLIKMADC